MENLIIGGLVGIIIGILLGFYLCSESDNNDI